MMTQSQLRFSEIHIVGQRLHRVGNIVLQVLRKYSCALPRLQAMTCKTP